MTRLLPVAGAGGFMLALYGVPAVVFITAATFLTIGFVAGYVAAHRERSSDA